MANEKTNSSKSILITVIVALLVGAATFYGGILYQKSQASSRSSQFSQSGNGQGGSRMMGGRRGFGGAVTGDIVSVDPTSLTVKLSDGSSKIVDLSSSTTYSKSTTGSLSDLTNGTKVAVFGTANSDGSVTAQNVQINPPSRPNQQSETTATPRAPAVGN